MWANIYLFLLLLRLILAQGIGPFSQENIKESSNLQIRKKRLIDPRPTGDKPVNLDHVPYIVYIEDDDEDVCGASILAHNIIITAAHCIDNPNATYTVHSGSSNICCGRFHYVRMKLMHPDYRSNGLQNDLALIVIYPFIDLEHSVNRRIMLYNKYVPPSTLGAFSGWGYHRIERNRHIYPKELRSIVVPTISIEECANIYHDVTIITDKDICTHDRIEQKHGADGDSGGPLVVDGYLVGVMAWSGDREGERANRENPDVFVNVAHPFYRCWIIVNIRLINGEF